MDKRLFLSNLRTSVRNLMKYKVQNAISILCLAVGIVCFTMTFHFVSGVWTLNYEDNYKSVRVHFLTDKEDFRARPFDRAAFKKLTEQQPASIGYLLFKETNLEAKWTLTDLEGREWEMQGSLTAVSPEYLRHYGFRSAITGKPITHLEPGTVIMSDGLWRKTLGEKTNPVGWFASVRADRTYSGPVNDVVRSNLRGQLEGMFVVSDTPFLSQFKEPVHWMDIALAEGKNWQELSADLQKLYTDRYPLIRQSDETSFILKTLALCGLFMFLGSIVLIIGLSGFLKMQLQLFSLRSREMALRRCVGARPWQLFWLLAIEVAIVFGVTTMVALSLTTVVADYALPVLYIMMDNSFYVDLDIVYRRELWISLLSTLLTLGIAALAVRRTLHAPLGMTAGRSNRTGHTGRSVVLVIQYVFCIFMLAVILGTYFFSRQLSRTFHLPEDSSGIKRCMLINRSSQTDVMTGEAGEPGSLLYFTNSELASLPSMEQDGCLLVSSHFSANEVDTTLYVNSATLMSEENTPLGYMYAIASANEQYFLVMGLHPVAAYEGMDYSAMVPVFVRPQDADRIARSVQAERGPRRRRVLADGHDYVSIGYVPVWREACRTFLPSFFMIVPEVEESVLRESLPQWNGTEANYYILRPKVHRYDELVEELNNLYHSKCPRNLMPLDISNVYDTWFTRVRWAEMLQQLCWILTVISLLCIIISVYSAVSLDTRGREKEVAIRKVHGAKMRDIILLFSRSYVRVLVVSALVAVPLGIGLGTWIINMMGVQGNAICLSCKWVMASFMIVAFIILITVWEKIYRVSRTNPSEIIAKE